MSSGGSFMDGLDLFQLRSTRGHIPRFFLFVRIQLLLDRFSILFGGERTARFSVMSSMDGFQATSMEFSRLFR